MIKATKILLAIGMLMISASLVECRFNDLSSLAHRRLSKIRSSYRDARQQTFNKEATVQKAHHVLEKAALLLQSTSMAEQNVAATSETVSKLMRRLQDECTNYTALVGNCTIEDYCNAFDASDPTLDYECTGEEACCWDLSISSKEECYYIFQSKEAGPFPFNETLYNPEMDVCFKCVLNITFDQFLPATYSQTLVITRPNEGEFTESGTLQQCGPGGSFYELFDGYCGSCLSAEVGTASGTVACNSCQECPADPDLLLNCSNISPGFVSYCVEDDDAYNVVLAYLKIDD